MYFAKVDCGNTDEVFILADHPWMKNGVDILVLNHGMYQRSSAKELTLKELELTMDVNFKGAVAVYTALSPHLNNSAKIIAIGSQLGIKGVHMEHTMLHQKGHFMHGQEVLLVMLQNRDRE